MCLKYLITLFVSLSLLAACSSELEGIEMWKIPSVDELSSEKALEPNYLLSSTVGAIYLRKQARKESRVQSNSTPAMNERGRS